MSTAGEQDGTTGARSIGAALHHYWWLALIVALPLIAGASGYAQSRPDEYEAQAIVAFVPRQRPETSADLVQLLLPRYAVYVRSQQTVRRLAGRLDEDPDRLLAGLDAVVPPETAQLELTVELGSARRSAVMANSLATDVVRFSRRDDVLAASAITDAVPPDHPTGPNRLALVAVGTAVALVLGVFTAVVAHRRRPHLGAKATVSSVATGDEDTRPPEHPRWRDPDTALR